MTHQQVAKAEGIWRIVKSIAFPLLAALIGYIDFKVKSDVLAAVSQSYVSVEKFQAVEEKLKQIPPLLDKVNNQEVNMAQIKENLENISRILVEMKIDIREINKTNRSKQ